MGYVRERSVLKAVDIAVSGPEAWLGPLFLDGASVHESLPQRELPITELRPLLLRPETTYEARDGVWSELAFLAQNRGHKWELGAIWMMSPGLRKASWRIVNNGWAPYADIEAEVVEGFLRELRAVDIDSRAVAGRLWWAGYRHGLRARDSYRAMPVRAQAADFACLNPRSALGGHPDQVLDRAVRAGVITEDESELIGCTRLEENGLAAAALQLDIGYQQCRARRTAAEERLAKYLVIPGPHRRSVPSNWSILREEAA
ncbi:hypothetical protein ACFYNO_24825 [Kitasatospora sp. NPDC006697]|uniref:hypothetical protein n=1 Tax=Kitasatospora sp. NPDC006697 TaxID=3364020 RepID=UPI0036847C1B